MEIVKNDIYKNVILNQAQTRSNRSPGKKEKKRDVGIVLIILAISIVLLLVDSLNFLIYPVQLFVVGLHELSHALMVYITGGEVTGIHIDPMVGGYCSFRIEDSTIKQILIASAGYLGSMLWGAAIFFLASVTKLDKVLSFILGLVMVFLAFLILKEWSLFGLIFALVFGGFLILSAFFLPLRFNDIMLKFLGLSSCSYVLVDIFNDLIGRYNIGNDSDIIIQLMGLPPVFSVILGIGWMILAILVMVFTIKKALA